MIYCTRYDMIDRFGSTELIQRTDRDNTGAIDETVLTQAMNDATAEMNAYLSGFALPAVSTVLVSIACDITRYRLYDDIAMYSDMGRPINQVAVRYERWLVYLKDVAAGKIKLSPDASGAVAESSNMPTMQSSGRVFGREQ